MHGMYTNLFIWYLDKPISRMRWNTGFFESMIELYRYKKSSYGYLRNGEKFFSSRKKVTKKRM